MQIKKVAPVLVFILSFQLISAIAKSSVLISEKENQHLISFNAGESSFKQIDQDNTKQWYGFEMLDSTLNGVPFKIVFPKIANLNRNWIWRARFWGHEPQTDLALLEIGFHLVYIEVGGLFGSAKAVKIWDDFYAFIINKYQLNKKVVLEGMSRGGLIIFNWGNQNAEKVACIYGDAPVCDFKSWPGGFGKGKGSEPDWDACLKQYNLTEKEATEYIQNPVDHMENIARFNVPILNVVGDADEVVPVAENTELLEKRLQFLGWKMEVIHKPGVGHHPHSLKNPLPIVSFILKNTGCTPQNKNLLTKYFYVSPEGNDANSGTIENPVLSFEGAQDLVRKFKKYNQETPVTVYFKSGKYYLKKPIVFSEKDTGTEKAKITYKAFPGEIPFILGGEKLKLKWEKYKEGIFKAEIPKGVVFESLFVNDELQVLARYPNFNSGSEIFNGFASDCISPEKVKTWKNPAGGYYHVIHGHKWGGYHFQITGKKSKTELEFTGGWQNNRPEGGQHKKYRFVENIFEELDTINEWYLDKKTSTLYFYPNPSIDLGKANIEYASLENLMTFKGSEKNPVSNITVDGFKFMRTIRTFLKNKEPLLRSDWTIYRGGSVFLEGTENCKIKNCEFSQIGGNAIFFNHFNKNDLVLGCHIYEVGANAICFVGDTSAVRNPKFIPYGPRVSLKEMDMTPGPKNNNFPQYCVVDNNLIHKIGTIEKQVAGVEISMAAFITLRHNSIYNVPRAGINIGEGSWGGHLIEFNDVFKTVQETGDHGSFNSWGRDRFWGVPKERTDAVVEQNRSLILLDMLAPNVIRNNRFRCDHGWDIDLDDGSSYYEIYNNLCLNGGIKLREGYYRTVENNICINNGFHPHVWQKNSGDIVRGNIFGSVHQPIYVDYWGKEVDFNWFINQEDLEKVQQLKVDKNSLSGNPFFVNPKKGDFSASLESPVYSIGWKNFPMDRFGVQKPELKKIAETPVVPEIIKTGIELNNTVNFYSGRIKNITTDGEISATGMSEKTGVLVLSTPTDAIFEMLKLKQNDVILEVNGIDVNNVTELRSEIGKGEVKIIMVWRDQKKIELKK